MMSIEVGLESVLTCMMFECDYTIILAVGI